MHRALLIVLCVLALLVARWYSRRVDEEACRRRDCGDGVGLLLRAEGKAKGRDVCLCVRR